MLRKESQTVPMLVTDCPRCGASKITFDVLSYNNQGTQYDWQRWYELFCICRQCHKSTTFVVSQKTNTEVESFRVPSKVMEVTASLNNFFKIDRYISLRDQSSIPPPEFVPEDIKKIFIEGSTCLSVQCWNAAATMFRQCLDLATKLMLPSDNTNGLDNHKRRNLAPRLTWLFENKLLPEDLRELATCIKEDGNDGAHDGTLNKEEAMDLLDFSTALLERIYTEKERIKQAEQRRVERRLQNS